MAPPRRAIGSSSGPSKAASVKAFVKSLYYDDFRWQLVKSIGLFGFGVYLANEFKGVDILGATNQP